jgi:hypothetical protein
MRCRTWPGVVAAGWRSQAQARQKIAEPEHFAGGTPALARLAGRSASHVARATVRWWQLTPTEIVNAVLEAVGSAASAIPC